jgi:hypothetical protein
MSAETWRAVPGFPMYEASNLGRVRSWRTYNRPVVPYLMTPTRQPNGYWYVRVTNPEGKSCNPTLHKLVTAAFFGERPEGLVVRHLDGNPSNNAVTNLTYGTYSENNDDSVAHGTHWEARLQACQKGHEFTPENTRVESRPNGRTARRCLTCQRAYDRARRAA